VLSLRIRKTMKILSVNIKNAQVLIKTSLKFNLWWLVNMGYHEI